MARSLSRLLESERSRLGSDASELERVQDAGTEFIKTHPEIIDRMHHPRRAIETQRASLRRPRPLARNDVPFQPLLIMQRRSVGASDESPRIPAVPTGPELSADPIFRAAGAPRKSRATLPSSVSE